MIDLTELLLCLKDIFISLALAKIRQIIALVVNRQAFAFRDY
jgi:hypothetical protein